MNSLLNLIAHLVNGQSREEFSTGMVFDWSYYTLIIVFLPLYLQFFLYIPIFFQFQYL